jgi:hypothetical protein
VKNITQAIVVADSLADFRVSSSANVWLDKKKTFKKEQAKAKNKKYKKKTETHASEGTSKGEQAKKNLVLAVSSMEALILHEISRNMRKWLIS